MTIKKYVNTDPPTDVDFLKWVETNGYWQHTNGGRTLWVTIRVEPAKTTFQLYDLYYKQHPEPKEFVRHLS